jgi:hypothetical protein
MEESAPTKTEEETTSSLRDRCRSTGHCRNFFLQPSEKENDDDTLVDRLASYQGTTRDELP